MSRSICVGLNSGTLWPLSEQNVCVKTGLTWRDFQSGLLGRYTRWLSWETTTLLLHVSPSISLHLFYPCFPNYRLISNLLMKQVLQDLPHVEGEENRLWAMELHMMDLWLLGCGSFVMWTILTFQIKRFKQFKSFLLQLALILLRDLGIWYSDRSLPWLSRLISIFKPDR